MTIVKDIALRPRFKMELNQNKDFFLKAFDAAKVSQKAFVVTRIDDHVFIKFPKKEQHFWSPQLHLEINDIEDEKCVVYGLFGPNPTVWTLFMFLHFLVAGLFIAFGIWAYTNWSLGNGYTIQLALLFLMVVLWMVLYFAGSIGKTSSQQDMRKLKGFMDEVIN